MHSKTVQISSKQGKYLNILTSTGTGPDCREEHCENYCRGTFQMICHVREQTLPAIIMMTVEEGH